jgi:hypothetical protein
MAQVDPKAQLPPPPGYGYGAPPPGQGMYPPPGYGYGYPPPPPPAAAQQQQTTTVVVSSQPTVVAMYHTSSSPVTGTCPSCQTVMTSQTSCSPGSKVLIWFIVLLIMFFFGCSFGLPLCWLPWVIPSCYNQEHRCSHCGATLGTYAPQCC